MLGPVPLNFALDCYAHIRELLLLVLENAYKDPETDLGLFILDLVSSADTPLQFDKQTTSSSNKSCLLLSLKVQPPPHPSTPYLLAAKRLGWIQFTCATLARAALDPKLDPLYPGLRDGFYNGVLNLQAKFDRDENGELKKFSEEEPVAGRGVLVHDLKVDDPQDFQILLSKLMANEVFCAVTARNYYSRQDPILSYGCRALPHKSFYANKGE